MGKKPEIQDIYALSPMQEGILFHAMLDSESTAYFEQIEFDIAGRVDVQLVEESMNAVIARHDVFRTLFVTDKVKQPRQVVLKERPIKVHYEDWSAFGPDEQLEKLAQFKAADMAKGFDLVRDPLMRLAVIRLGETSCRWLWSHHHIVMDGWCVSIVMKHFMEYYQLKQQGLPVQQGKTAPYSSYIAWLGEQDREEALGYWERALAGYEQTASVPRVGPAERTGVYRQHTVSRSLPEETTAALQRLAVASQATMSTVVQCIWGILLQKYNRTEDAVFGAVVSGRPSGIPGIEDMVGLFINTVPVRVKADGGSFASLVRRVQEASLEAETFSFVPLYEIQNRTPLKQHLLDHILVFENYPVQQELEDTAEETGSEFQICGFQAYEQTNYDFDITVAPGEGLTFQFSFNAEVYDPAFIEQLAAHVEHIAVQAAADPDIRVSDIELLSAEEKNRLAAAFNATDAGMPQKTVHELFEEHAARMPEQTAVLYGNERISYGALNARVNQLARYLLAQGTAREELVAILMDRSPDMLAAILAVWKAGGAYVPVDPGYPAARQQTIIRESGVRFIIGNSESVSAMEEGASGNSSDGSSHGSSVSSTNDSPGSSTDGSAESLSASSRDRSPKLILLDRVAGTIAQEPSDNIGLPVKPNQLAYVIYTSGSTGTPKGTMIEHAGMLNHILAEIEELEITEGTVLAQNASHCFDISVWQFVAALTVGGVTAIYPNELVLEPAQFIERIIKDKTAILEVVPSYLSVMMDRMEDTGVRLPDLKYLMITGETVKPAMVRRWFGLCPDIRMVNAYGPAEAADDISQYVMDKPPESEPVPIGRPIRNMRIYIVDDQLRLCPVGTIGEICVSGIGVGRGYLRDPERTAAVFLEDPFREEEGVRMYRTGDLGRWLPDGNIEFYGRKDYQVKIRGFRIELGEIEARLAEYGGVKEAVVLDVEDAQGVKQLAAYVTAAGGTAPETAELKAYLARHLPEYMVPASVQVLAELPLSPNGKIDRKALPKPELALGGGMAGGPLRTETERKLAAIWQEVLGVAEAGREQSFFEAGGHSLKAMTLVSRIHKELGAELPLREVFARPLLHMQAAYIDQAAGHGEAYTRIPQALKQPHYPLSYAQRRMYLLQQMNPGQTGYNMPAVVEVTGMLDTQRVKRVFRQLIERHEALRTSFHMVNKEPVQRIHESAELEMKLVALPEGLSSSEEQAKVRELVESFIQPFDLSEAPLMRAGWIQCAEDRYILLADFHHIISDGVSMNVLVEEFNRLYNGEALAPLAVQYKDYAVWQQQPKQRERLAEQERYWLSVLDGELPQLQLPADYPRPAVKSFEGATLSFQLEPGVAARINKLAADQQSTLFIMLLSAYHVMLSKCSGQDDIITGVPTAGRPQAELEQVFGMFVNTLALRSRPAADQSFRSFAGQMKDHVLAAFENQDYPFEELATRLRVERDMSRNPVFETMFVMQNAGEAEGRDYGLTFQPYPLEYRMAKFDLTLSAVEDEQDGSIGFSLEYSTRLFRQETAGRLAGYYTRVLEQIAGNPDMPLQDITVLSESEEHNLLYGWNRTAAEYPRDKTIHQIFEEQTALWADRTALVHEGRRLTYRELNSRANTLAHRMRAGGAGRGTIAAVMSDRSASMVTALLAVLKAGGTYLPVDPAYPQERVQYMLEDSSAAWLLTDGSGQIPESFTGQVLRLDELDIEWAGPSGLEAAAVGAAANPEPINEPSDLAYIIYTSGTTGKPKGAMLEHRNVVRLLHNERSLFDFSERDVWTMFHSYCFDFSVWEMYGALLYGGTLVVVPRETAVNPQAFLQLLAEERVTVLNQTPTAFYQLLQEEARHERLLKLRYVIFGGEALKPLLLKPFHARYPDTQLVNMYGITETTVHVTYKAVTEAEIEANSDSIGMPIPTLTAYVLDGQLKPVPIGVTGELYVGGEGVCRGYLNRPELTAERFIESPFVPGERLYKSGDLVKRLPSGELAYMGRIDHQVKIRGHRIELAEVEAALLRHEAVQEAVVLARDDGDGQAYLCAYYTAAAAGSAASTTLQAAGASELRSYLKSAVPDYMIPSYFVPLAAIPMTVNGKVDRKALPAPQDHVQTGAPYAAPQSEAEVVLAGIWQDVLGISRAGIDDHFFESGGHSLKAMALSDEISRVLGISLPLQEVFLRPTIRELAAYVEANIQREVRHEQHQHLVLLKKGKDQNRHVFMIHGGSGDVTVYVPLVNLLPDEANYWGIQLPPWEQPSPRQLSIEELAAAYAGYMAEIQPHGSYTIVGMSLGGTIGYEVARLLEARGQQVERLVLIDSHAPAAAVPVAAVETEFSLETELELAGDLLSRMDGMNIFRETGLMGACRTMEEVWTHVIQTVEQHERRDELLAGIKLLADEDIRQTIPHFDQLSLGKLLPYVHMIRSLTAAFARYSLQPLQDCTPDLIIAAASADLDAARWSAGGSGQVRTYTAEGDHYSIFTAPYVAGLAATMHELIQHKEAAGQPV